RPHEDSRGAAARAGGDRLRAPGAPGRRGAQEDGQESLAPRADRGNLSRWYGGLQRRAHTVEDVAVEAVGEKALQRTPQPAWSQVSTIPRRQHELRATRVIAHLVGASRHRDAILDAQLLDEHVEPDEARSLGRRDPLLDRKSTRLNS